MDDLFDDLDAEFKPYNEEINAQIKIVAVLIQPGETFNKFLTRFNVILGPLHDNKNTQKVTWLLNALRPNSELRRLAIDNHISKSYQSLCTHLRDVCSHDQDGRYVLSAEKCQKIDETD